MAFRQSVGEVPTSVSEGELDSSGTGQYSTAETRAAQYYNMGQPPVDMAMVHQVGNRGISGPAGVKLPKSVVKSLLYVGSQGSWKPRTTK